MIIDYHMHMRDPDRRINFTVNAVERYVETASARGIDEIGFTEHVYYFKQNCVIALVPALILNFAGALFGVIVALLYLLFQDGLKRRQSYGKRLTKTAVIDEQTGLWRNFWQSFLRNLLLSILGFIDWLFILGARRQRLGDRLAHTVVVKLSADSPDSASEIETPLSGSQTA